jgi:hypothetical protein
MVLPFFLKAQIGIGKKQIDLFLLNKKTIIVERNNNIDGRIDSKNKVMSAPKYKEAFFCTIENRIAKRRRLGFDFGVE